MRTILAALMLASLPVGAGADDRPNILFIMADDHAAHAISAYGSRVNVTPNIDRIGREGVRLLNCFATNAICTPSRAAILTGQYAHLNGVPVFNRFDGRASTVARDLQAAGYHTGMVGKWHLGSEPTGFDDWTILPGQGAYFDAKAKGKITVPGHCTDATTELGLKFLDARPRDRPFFLMLHHKAPHRPGSRPRRTRRPGPGARSPSRRPATTTTPPAPTPPARRPCGSTATSSRLSSAATGGAWPRTTP